MATDNVMPAMPGDVIQDTDGLFLLVTEVRKRGVGAIARWREGPDIKEHYARLAHGQYRVVAAAPMLPPEVQQARRAALQTARAVEREADR